MMLGMNAAYAYHPAVTSLPMIIQPMSDAKDTELQLQIMLTKE